MSSPHVPQRQGLDQTQLATLAAVIACISWGMFGLYFKILDQVSPLEILSHRILWSVGLLAILITALNKWPEIIPILRSPKRLAIYALSALLISVNWGMYIYAVTSGQALEASMGYFIMPLVAVMLGGIFFAERFSKPQLAAIALAVVGVIYQVVFYGSPPWIALCLAFSFGFYGMIRKKAEADAISGLFLETLLISPLALGFMAYAAHQGELFYLTADLDFKALLMFAGVVTTFPLVLFAYGARHLRYSTVGIIQYINPSAQFLIAVFIFGEAFTLHTLITFACIWAALLLYSQNSYAQSRRNKRANS
ncbi:EamA family transporter RarD [Terasakiella pusilla]|uniref:EamA family transporter RarD n=1 Tax=Terasakiella pusilla TaxID=64973 RepID=UPI003AA8D586